MHIDARRAGQAPHATEGPADVCVVTYNSATTITRLLKSLDGDPAVRHVLLFDNASSDDTLKVVRETLRRLDVPVSIEASRRNIGFPAACNRLLLNSTSPVMALVNPDVELPDGSLGHLVAEVSRDPSIGIATCRLTTRDGRPQRESARPRPSLRRLIGSCMPRWVRSSAVAGTLVGNDSLLYVDHDVECTSGALMVFRRDLIEAVGLLDESVFMYLEDIDFCARVRRAGYRIRYLGSIWVWHDSGVSSGPHRSELSALLPKVWLAYLSRYGSRFERAAARPVLVFVSLRAAIDQVAHGNVPRGELLAVWYALSHTPPEVPKWSC